MMQYLESQDRPQIGERLETIRVREKKLSLNNDLVS